MSNTSLGNGHREQHDPHIGQSWQRAHDIWNQLCRTKLQSHWLLWLAADQSTCLPACLPVCLPVYLSACLSACQSNYQTACLTRQADSCLPIYQTGYLLNWQPGFRLAASATSAVQVRLTLKPVSGSWIRRLLFERVRLSAEGISTNLLVAIDA